MNWPRKPEAPEPPIRYHDKMRQWSAGTWPYSKLNDDNQFESHHGIDDGTDENEVVDVQHRQDVRI